MSFQISHKSLKPSDCNIEQAGVKAVGGDRSPLLQIGVALVVVAFVLSLACNIVLFLWTKDIELTVGSNAKNFLTAFERLEQEVIALSSTEDDEDDDYDEDEEFDGSYKSIVRIQRDKKTKSKKKSKDRKLRRWRKCKCQPTRPKKKNKQKRDVLESNVTAIHLKGLSMDNSVTSAVNADGVFLWKIPEWQYGVIYEYGYEEENIHSIKIHTGGIYEVYSQVVLRGSTTSEVNARECGHNLIREHSGINTTLVRSLITQVNSYSYGGYDKEHGPVDTAYVHGYFPLASGDRIFIRKGCNHVEFPTSSEDLSYFGARQHSIF